MTKYINYTISYGDTLQSIAQRQLEDTERWVELALLNDLEYPFIVYSRELVTKGVKTFGDTLLIPLEKEYVDVIDEKEKENLYEKALGEDLDLFGDNTASLTEDETGELRNDSYGDLATVVGLRNFKQGLMLRLSTAEGALLHHPTYGSRLNLIIGSKGTYEQLQKTKIEVERVIRCDARTKDINFEQVILDNDAVYMKIRVQPIDFDTEITLALTIGEGGMIEWG